MPDCEATAAVPAPKPIRWRADETAQLLASIVESSDDAIISKDLDGVIVSWNKSAERLFGYTAAEIIGKPVTVLIPEDRLDEEPHILERIRRGERVDHYETLRQRKDGRLINISLTVSPVKDDDGRIVGASKIARDITERKHGEALRDLLMAELSHRVRNTLAMVIAIAHQSFTRARSVDEARHSFEARIRALAQTHSCLAQTNWAGVPLERLVSDETAPYRGGCNTVRIAGPEITLNAKAALSLGLGLHELATNAAKYGALSTKTGALAIEWHLVPAKNELILSWTETGGPAVSPPQHSGFGRLLLERALAADLNGTVTLDFAPEGFTCLIAFPLGRRAGDPMCTSDYAGVGLAQGPSLGGDVGKVLFSV